MDLLITVIIIAIVIYIIINKVIRPVKFNCEECLRSFKTHPKKVKTKCTHCDTEYIYKADGTITRRKENYYKKAPL